MFNGRKLFGKATTNIDFICKCNDTRIFQNNRDGFINKKTTDQLLHDNSVNNMNAKLDRANGEFKAEKFGAFIALIMPISICAVVHYVMED